jgi:hypothetical protein
MSSKISIASSRLLNRRYPISSRRRPLGYYSLSITARKLFDVHRAAAPAPVEEGSETVESASVNGSLSVKVSQGGSPRRFTVLCWQSEPLAIWN